MASALHNHSEYSVLDGFSHPKEYLERAKEIALSHAGLASNQVTFQRTELDFDNGIQKYEIEFYYNYREYSYEIDANTGNILSYEQD